MAQMALFRIDENSKSSMTPSRQIRVYDRPTENFMLDTPSLGLFSDKFSSLRPAGRSFAKILVVAAQRGAKSTVQHISGSILVAVVPLRRLAP